MKKWKWYSNIALCMMLCVGALSACGQQGENQYNSKSISLQQAKEEEKESEGASAQLTEEKESEEESSQPEEEEALLPEALPLEFSFLSGAGAWRTDMTVQRDGSFEGTYLDADAGDTGKKYPHGTVYTCEFHGKFGDIQQINEYTYSMTLEEITLKYEEKEKWIENGLRYIATGPYGISGSNDEDMGKEFLFYTPDAPREELSEEFLSWWQGGWLLDGEIPETLSCYGIYNKHNEHGFFSYE